MSIIDDIIITEENEKISIGTMVTTKKIGLPAIGTVIGIIIFKLYGMITNLPPDATFVYENIYPDFRDKLIACVSFEHPQMPISFEEFKLKYKNYDRSEEWLKTHYQDIAPIRYQWYPIDDLELYEE